MTPTLLQTAAPSSQATSPFPFPSKTRAGREVNRGCLMHSCSRLLLLPAPRLLDLCLTSCALRWAEPSMPQPRRGRLPASPALARASLPLLFLLRSPSLERCWQRDAALHSIPCLGGSQPPCLQCLVDGQRQHLESLDHVAGILGRGLDILHPQRGCQLLCLLPAHPPLPCQVALVPHKQEDDAEWLDRVCHLPVPLPDALKGRAVGEVKKQHPPGRVAVVRASHGSGVQREMG